MDITRTGAALLAALLAPSAQAAIFTVGSDAACTHSNILSAISAASTNGPAVDEIRVAMNQTYASQVLPIASHSVQLRGGYATCAATTPTGYTVIGGTAAGVNGTITTTGVAASAFTVLLERLELRDGGNQVSRRGGAVRIGGHFDVTVRNVRIVENQAGRGGGIYVDGTDGATLWLTGGTTINNNLAGLSGGGIYCLGGADLQMGNAVIADNSAIDTGSDPHESGNGGGVALYEQCRMVQSGDTDSAGVRDNFAERYGGGYYLRSADLFLLGSSSAPAWVFRNQADAIGGGIAVNDDISNGIPGFVDSQVGIENSRIDNNLAAIGGGIGLVVGGTVSMNRTLFGNACHNATRCSTLSQNSATDAGAFCVGAAISAGLISSMLVRQTIIDNNCPTLHGYAVRVADNAQLRIDSSVLARNNDEPFGFDPSFDGRLDLSWSTVTGHLNGPQFSLMLLPSNATATGDVFLFGNILGEPFQHLYSVLGGGTTPMTVTADCLVLDTTFVDATTPIRAVETTAPWGMTAPATGNYRPASGLTSLPVDFCDGSLAPRVLGDMDGNTGIVDQPRANLFGTRDVGAYELAGGGGDTVFANGFE
jgi:hypothetical protein